MSIPERLLALPAVDLIPVRGRITTLSSRIIFKLEDRSHFLHNPSTYIPGAIPLSDKSGLSFFEYSVKGLEDYHGLLGRWKYPDEYPLMISVKPEPITSREVSNLPLLPAVGINFKDPLFNYYTKSLLPRICQPGDDPNTYGETAYMDADVVALLNERINLGRYVAVSKVNSDQTLWDKIDDSEGLNEALRDRNREKVVIDSVTAVASKLGLDMGLTKDLFRWVLDATTDLEVKYLQGLAKITN